MANLLIPALIVGLLAVGFGIARLRRLSLGTLVFIIAGAVTGLLLGALASVPLSKLPAPFGQLLPVLISVVLTIIFIPIALSQRGSVLRHIPFLGKVEAGQNSSGIQPVLVDTSVIIDGRIADIAEAGFVPGRLLVPQFVLAELQNIADSDDPLRRGRGRRGLEVLTKLQEVLGNRVEIIDQDPTEIKEVDAKLVALANQLQAHVLTTDYNLNRVAQIQGVRVLNVNELSNAIRPAVIPGEELRVRIVQAGKERHQGVGYLSDGTMIVVENGDKLIGQEISTEVTRVFQTVAGKMIFATPKKGHEAPIPIDSPATVPSRASDELPQPIEIPSVVDEEKVPASANGRHQPRRPGGNRNGHHRGGRPKSAEDRLIQEVNGRPQP